MSGTLGIQTRGYATAFYLLLSASRHFLEELLMGKHCMKILGRPWTRWSLMFLLYPTLTPHNLEVSIKVTFPSFSLQCLVYSGLLVNAY